MRKIALALITGIMVMTGAASAQIVGAVGWLQGGTANSASAVQGGGGSGAAIIGVAGTTTQASSGNVSQSLVTQTPGVNNVQTGSVSTGQMSSLSGALGLAGAGSGSAFGSNGAATGAGGQIGGALFAAP